MQTFTVLHLYSDGLVQEKRNSIANALELRLSYTNPSIMSMTGIQRIPTFTGMDWLK